MIVNATIVHTVSKYFIVFIFIVSVSAPSRCIKFHDKNHGERENSNMSRDPYTYKRIINHTRRQKCNLYFQTFSNLEVQQPSSKPMEVLIDASSSSQSKQYTTKRNNGKRKLCGKYQNYYQLSKIKRISGDPAIIILNKKSELSSKTEHCGKRHQEKTNAHNNHGISGLLSPIYKLEKEVTGIKEFNNEIINIQKSLKSSSKNSNVSQKEGEPKLENQGVLLDVSKISNQQISAYYSNTIFFSQILKD